MSSKTTGEMYDEIVLKGTGQYMGSLRNPVSKLRSGPQGRRYNAIYVVNPIEGGEISRVLISQATCQVKCNSKLEKISEGEFQLRHLRGR